MKEKRVYALCIVVLIITAFFSTGYYYIDEQAQILEFAGLKLNLTTAANLTWEYHYQMRPAIQPAIVVLLANILNFAGISSPFTIAVFLRLLSAAIGFSAMFLIYKAYCKTISGNTLKKWFLLLSFFLWFMIFNNVRYCSEGWSGSIFIIAFSILKINKSPNKLFYLLAGCILGLSFLFRYQTGFLIGGLLLWFLFIRKEIAGTALLLLGMVLLAGIGVLIDRWFYGNWVLTTWNYLDQNILQNKVSGFGIQPWWFYFKDVFIRLIPPFSIIFIFSFFLVFIFKKKDVLTWTIFPFLIIHFIIGHKETRFLFPIIGFLPIFIIQSVEIIQQRWNKSFTENIFIRFSVKLFWVINIIFLLVIAFKPASDRISVYHKIYSDYSCTTILYYLHDDPFHNNNFYKRTSLDVVKTDSVEQIDLIPSKKQLLITEDTNVVKGLKMHHKLIYSTFPDWLVKFDFGHWVERANFLHVYELYN